MPDQIVLVGLSGSGKSAVARCLAERLGRPVVDVDDLVERRTGRSPTQLIELDGVATFRSAESRAVAEAAAVPGAVIATGGGAVIDPLNRWALWSAGTVVWLDAPDAVLADRLASDAVGRPLLGGNGSPGAEEKLAELRQAREPFYRAADLRIDASGPVEVVAARVAGEVAAWGGAAGTAAAASATAMAPRRLFDAQVPRMHPMGPPRARIVLGRDLDAPALAAILDGVSTGEPLVVADQRVARALPGLLSALPAARRLVIRAGERAKRLRVAERLLESAAGLGLERGDAWIAVGGGTTGDLVGTAAALYHRGAPLVHVPTTWLAEADSAIGGKVAVDLARSKNAAGAFWPPVAVIADVAALRTLPRRRLLDGMAECLKGGLIGDPTLWRLVEQRGAAAARTTGPDEAARYAILELAVRLKLGVVERDPYETGERRALNLGHTIGHALEIQSGYRLPHGAAVALGVRAVATIAAGRGAEPGLRERIDSVLAGLGYALTRRFDPVAVRAALAGDKKRLRGRQRWILPMEVGRVIEVDDVRARELDAALRSITAGEPRTGAVA